MEITIYYLLLYTAPCSKVTSLTNPYKVWLPNLPLLGAPRSPELALRSHLMRVIMRKVCLGNPTARQLITNLLEASKLRLVLLKITSCALISPQMNWWKRGIADQLKDITFKREIYVQIFSGLLSFCAKYISSDVLLRENAAPEAINKMRHCAAKITSEIRNILYSDDPSSTNSSTQR